MGYFRPMQPVLSEPICFSPYLYRARNLVERFFNKIKQCRRVATRYDSSQPTTSHSFSLLRSDYGCALMSPRPRACSGPIESLDFPRACG